MDAATLSAAIEAGELTVVYQTIVNANLAAVGAESLVRWNRDGVNVPPSVFVPELEAAGLAGPLTEFVMMTAATEASSWELPLHVSVNVSADGYDPSLIGLVGDVLTDTGLEPNRLVIEVTESAELHDPASAADVTAGLHKLGVKVAVDDFGSGFSDQDRVVQLGKVDWVKIDRSVIEAAAESITNLEVLRSMVTFAHDLGAGTVAEGVTTGFFGKLVDIGVDMYQGFDLAHPAATPVFRIAA